jgi:hypothetical protein
MPYFMGLIVRVQTEQTCRCCPNPAGKQRNPLAARSFMTHNDVRLNPTPSQKRAEGAATTDWRGDNGAARKGEKHDVQ